MLDNIMTLLQSTHLIVQIKFGSHLFGTATPESDLDIKAIYLPSARNILLQRVSPLLSDGRQKERGEKNTSADTDLEAFSLHRYLELLSEGQTVALDMLFAPDWAMMMSPTQAWRDIQEFSPKILTKGATAFVRYCRQQANKYGIKGSRVAAARKTLAVLQKAESQHGATARLEIIIHLLEQLASEDEFITLVDLIQQRGDIVRCIDVCGKKAILTSTIKNARDIVQRLVDEYGQRALAAERNEGVDWKALSHAVRIGHEAVELFQTGKITFPRPEAEHLLAIKRGQIIYAKVAEEIEQLLVDVENAAALSKLPDKVDQVVIDDFVADMYRKQVMQG
jgi:predicted nucleotidyltransferase